MKYQHEVIKIIEETITLTENIDNIDIDTNLQNVGMDSISFVRVVVKIENQFDIKFPDEKLVITLAGTIKSLCEIIIDIKDNKME